MIKRLSKYFALLRGRGLGALGAGAVARAVSHAISRTISGTMVDRAGSAVIEFAIAAPVMILMVGGIVETSTVLLINTMIEGAATDAAREIRTGQIQRTTDPLAQFRTRLCGGMLNLVDCGHILFDVRNFSGFSGANITLQLDKDGNPVGGQFTPGGAQAITFVRVMFRYQFITPLVGRLLSDNGTNSTLLVSTAVFQNEPYQPL